VPNNFGVDMLFTHSSRDELRVLRAKVEHEYSLGGDARRLCGD
jgi:hypothetical protein